MQIYLFPKNKFSITWVKSSICLSLPLPVTNNRSSTCCARKMKVTQSWSRNSTKISRVMSHWSKSSSLYEPLLVSEHVYTRPEWGQCFRCQHHLHSVKLRAHFGMFILEEMYFFQDARKKLENSYFFQFLPEETGWNGRNWKKLKYKKTLNICLVSNITSTHISVFIKDGINLFTDSTFQFPNQPNVKDAAISELRV